jgi:hypothetical protein
MKLRISECDYRTLRRLTAISFRDDIEFQPETGGILLVSRNEHPLNPALIVAGILEPAEGDLTESAKDGLTFSRSYLRRALLEVRRRKLAGFLTVHTHPLSCDAVGFSEYDDANDPSLMANLSELQPTGTFGSMVLGAQVAAGRVWAPDIPGFLPLTELISVGERIQYLPLDGTMGATPSPTAMFDRAMAVTGAGALATLARTRVGVVGAGGTGSLIVELAARAGVGEVFVFDFDEADLTNLNRVLHLRQEDVDHRRSKAERLSEVVRQSGLPCTVTAITRGDIRKESTAYDLLACDVLIGCVDRDWPRLILSEIAYQFHIPYLDIGTEIGLGPEGIASLDVRASYTAAGRPCLMCAGVISPERIRLEGYGEAELERVLGMGYSTDFRLKAPAVMELNMRAASWAMLLLRHLLQPFLEEPLPHSIRESITNFSTRSREHAQTAGCPICANPERLGAGGVFPLHTLREELN